MALNIRSLILYASAPVATNQSINFYKYATTEAVATVTAANYFNGAANKLKVGDQIDAVCAVGGALDRVNLQVTAIAAGVVTVAINTDASGA